MNNIVLCGFMGCGKSSVGKLVARLSGRTFVDTDALTEKSANMTVSKMFEEYGEAGFRDAEHLTCKAVADMSGAIVSTGGGALTFERNVSLFCNDTVVFLDVPFDEICHRIGNDGTRPLFKDKDKAKALFEQRTPLYRKAAHVTVDGTGNPKVVANRILSILKEGEGK